MRKISLLALVLVLIAVPSFAAKKYVIKISSYYGATHPVSQTIEYFKKNLEAESNGQFEVQYFPNSQLGGEEAIIDHAKRGTLQVGIVGSLIKKDEAKVGAMEVPFAIETWKQAKEVYSGEGAKMLEGDYTKKTNTYIKGYFVNGFRVISSVKSIANMEELGTMKIRVPGTDVFVNMFQGLGTNTVMMPMGEVYNALETKVVDGQDNPYPTLKANGWWEVQDYVLESRHMFSANAILVNGKFYDNLPKDMQALFDKWMNKAVDYNWEISEKADNEAKKFVQDNGLKIITPDAKYIAQMREALTKSGFYDWFFKQVPGSKEFMEYCLSLEK